LVSVDDSYPEFEEPENESRRFRRSNRGLASRRKFDRRETTGTAGIAGSKSELFFHGLLYGVHPMDPVVFLFVPFVLLLVALLASLIPSLRAARLDPPSTLRAG
jgi:hypothetical protein